MTADVGSVDYNLLDVISIDANGDLGPEVAITFGASYDFAGTLVGAIGDDIDFVLSGLDFGGLAVTGFELDPAGLFAGVTASLVGDSLTFSFQEQLVVGSAGDLLAGGRFVTATPVPLPASALLMIGAVGALGAARTRRKKATA
ncbi:VPLPA-CTERM sorting domain-containing protein [Antarctobacter jejuensis]|uniref:VPLPA-CTERM sorting domain-containing protein n=1 Tax=Antarctobacter jejuensis TaxID=1439938 RepID=UPI003FCF75DE